MGSWDISRGFFGEKFRGFGDRTTGLRAETSWLSIWSPETAALKSAWVSLTFTSTCRAQRQGVRGEGVSGVADEPRGASGRFLMGAVSVRVVMRCWFQRTWILL